MFIRFHTLLFFWLSAEVEGKQKDKNESGRSSVDLPEDRDSFCFRGSHKRNLMQISKKREGEGEREKGRGEGEGGEWERERERERGDGKESLCAQGYTITVHKLITSRQNTNSFCLNSNVQIQTKTKQRSLP